MRCGEYPVEISAQQIYIRKTTIICNEGKISSRQGKVLNAVLFLENILPLPLEYAYQAPFYIFYSRTVVLIFAIINTKLVLFNVLHSSDTCSSG